MELHNVASLHFNPLYFSSVHYAQAAPNPGGHKSTVIIIIMVVITSFIIVTLISILPFHMFLCCKRYHQSQLFLIWTSDWSLFSRHLILKPLLLLLSFLFSVRFWSISVSLQRPTRRIYRLSENFGQKQTLKTRKAENLKDIQTFYFKICFLETVNCIFC